MKLTCLLLLAVLVSCLQTGRAAHLAPLLPRLTRQAGRYGVPGYRPALGYNLNVRSGVHSTAVKSAPPGGGRPQGVGGFSFGGMASGRPAYGADFVVNGGGPLGPRPQAYGGSAGRPQPNPVYRAGSSAAASNSGGGGGRPVSAFQYS